MNDLKKVSGKIKITGEITALVRRQTKKHLQLWNGFLRGLFNLGLINRGTLFKLYAHGKLVRSQQINNIIANAGFNVIAEILAGEYADTGAITQMALGNGVGTPAVGDTALFNEVYRNNKASSTSSANVSIITAFFTEVEVSGTFTEFGNFIDDTELWSHVNVAWTKGSDETLTVQAKYTFTNKP